MKDHLCRSHLQYRAFKNARTAALDPTTATSTIHIDWAENPRLRQAGEEKGAYYYEDHVSVHAMYFWNKDGEFSVVSLSDFTDHGEPAIIASISPVMENLIQEGCSSINIVSDSPMSQYRNKTIFWFMETFAKKHSVHV